MWISIAECARPGLAGLEVESVEIVGYPGAELPWDLIR
jgi:hypothetical protein